MKELRANVSDMNTGMRVLTTLKGSNVDLRSFSYEDNAMVLTLAEGDYDRACVNLACLAGVDCKF